MGAVSAADRGSPRGLLLAVAVLAFGACSSQDEKVRLALEWGRLDPLPASARDLDVRTLGGPFTRQFQVVFTADPADVGRWLESSEGVRGVPAEPVPGGGKRWELRCKPGGAFGHLTVDETGTRILIDVSWS